VDEVRWVPRTKTQGIRGAQSAQCVGEGLGREPLDQVGDGQRRPACNVGQHCHCEWAKALIKQEIRAEVLLGDEKKRRGRGAIMPLLVLLCP